MNDQPSTATTNAASSVRMQENSSASKNQLRADIGSKWGKSTTRELSDLKDKGDLVIHSSPNTVWKRMLRRATPMPS